MSQITHSRDARVVGEPRVYSRHAPFSFFRDQAMVQYDVAARARLDRHLVETWTEIDSRSAEGRRAERELLSLYRDGPEKSVSALKAEVRAATSSSISGFTTPQWIISEWGKFREPRRTFADQCRVMPMPETGLTFHVPRFVSAASAGVQAEGGAVTELDPTGTDNQENLQTIAGQILTSQQTIDRTGNMPDGPSFDLILYSQLRESYDRGLDNYALGKAMGAGARFAGQATFSLANFYQDIATAREKLQDTAGVRLQPSHIFTTPDLYGFATRQVDAQQRPLIVPAFAPGTPLFSSADEHAGWDQFTGTVLPGTLMWFVDSNIPPSTTNTQVVVGRPDKMLLWETEPVTRAFPETLANNLVVVAQMYSYAALIPQTPGATASFTGAGYPLTNF